METVTLQGVYRAIWRLYWGDIGIMENNMETTISGLEFRDIGGVGLRRDSIGSSSELQGLLVLYEV